MEDGVSQLPTDKGISFLNFARPIQKELYSKVLSILEKENELGIANHDLSKAGLHFRIEPFMVRNGYRDGAGWWIKDK